MNPEVLAVWGNALLVKSIWLVAVVVIDLTGGMVVAVNNGDFDWEEVPAFLKTLSLFIWAFLAFQVLGLLPELLGFTPTGVSELFVTYSPDAVFGLAVAKYCVSILKHIGSIFKGFGDVIAKMGLPPTKSNGS